MMASVSHPEGSSEHELGFNGVGLIHSMYAPGSYSVNISTDCKVTSFRQAGARLLPVSVNHCHESGVGSAQGLIRSCATTGIIARGWPTYRAFRSASNWPCTGTREATSRVSPPPLPS